MSETVRRFTAVPVPGKRVSKRAHGTHFSAAKADLTDLLVELAAEGRDRLPAEDQLSATLGVSRPTIRSALLALEKEGKIQRRHGIGTLINRHALALRANLTEGRPFIEVIADLGYEPSVDTLRIEERELPEEIAAPLGMRSGARGVTIRRLFRASGKPVVSSQDYVPSSFLTADVGELSAELSTYAFIDRWTPHRVRYSVTEIRAVVADEVVSGLLCLRHGAAAIKLDLLHITERDEPVGVTHAYINDGMLRFGIVRSDSMV